MFSNELDHKAQTQELERRRKELEEQQSYHEHYQRYISEKDHFLRKSPYTKPRITPVFKQFLKGTGIVFFLIMTFMLLLHLRGNKKHGFSDNQRIINEIQITPKKNEFLCVNTKQGKYLITDQHGRVCSKLEMDHSTGCCPKNDTSKFQQHTCHSCQIDEKCCKIYEFCVSCCLSPNNNNPDLDNNNDNNQLNSNNNKEAIRKFHICKESCRTSSRSVINENVYRSNYKYCFDLKVKS
ncbi:hypothetical protein M0812_19618 [Anaeramoeba flamelloides]|uniref:SREBP regulating gene protein n=1 Tax=Anaeramoeba flamelloides TaxID=1746091 RepID=A0AAV7Z5S6_9EUKA|nr:hypothetical protein M0812_19618 [Anaeramoeba flamelloides]